MTAFEDGQHSAVIENVRRYYHKSESRIGYMVLLGGTKHFGYYRPGDNPLAMRAALRRMEEELAGRLDLPAGARVLDAGCGMGDTANGLAQRHGLRVTGIDILDFNLRTARTRAVRSGVQGLTSFVEMDYSDLGFGDGEFDGVYTLETLVHAADAEQVLREFYRVIKPGGRLVLFEYSHVPDRMMSRRARRVIGQINDWAAMPSLERFEHGVLESMVEKAGFTDVTSEDVATRIAPMLRIFAIAGLLPYALCTLVGKKRKATNAMSGVELHRYRHYFRYNLIVARR